MKRRNQLELKRLAKDISSIKGNCLSIFFTAKTHKDGVPFRSIVSEKGSWQLHVSRYLLKHLGGLTIQDAFATRNSIDAIDFLRDNVSIGYLFSVDVGDPFYSIPHNELFVAVRECIEENGDISFQNSAGICVDDFMSLLKFYLGATVMSFDSNLYVQK